MNKRIFAALAALMMMASVPGCKNKKDESSESSAEQSATSAEESATEEETTAATTTKAAKTTASSTTTKPAAQTTTAAAVPEISDDEMLIATAQRLYEISCDTMWNFTVGCPYDIDLNNYTENQYGWQYYLVTTEGINSVADVRDDYHQLFSDKYPDELDQLYIDKDGRVYALSAGRGQNIFYESSEVTGIESKTDDEIFFSVVNHMSGNDFGEGPYDEETTFSLVIEEQALKVGKFRLPY